ncbi:hypothetical protein Ciccas_010319 [Cichlidogyrus casuarinus]|uniref:Uncharacterized protein n=1 Tax=Cichlidogyrus casuarinus TaxID=1844966 RepID=A0ABD2PZ30_9PLAT
METETDTRLVKRNNPDLAKVRSLLQLLFQQRDKIDQLNEFSREWERLDIKSSLQVHLDGESFLICFQSLDAWTTLTTDRNHREKLAATFEVAADNFSKFTYVIIRELHDETTAMSAVRTYENNYRYYVGYGILCIPSLIALCLYFGVCFGICGRRPRPNSGFCNKNVGANFLLG